MVWMVTPWLVAPPGIVGVVHVAPLAADDLRRDALDRVHQHAPDYVKDACSVGGFD